VTVITCAPNFPLGRVFEGYRNRLRQCEEMEGIRVVRVKTYMTPNQGTVRRLLDFLSFMVSGGLAGLVERRPDVVAATSPQFFSAVGGWLVSVARRRPFVFELGDLWPASITAVGAMRENLLLRLMERLELFLYRRSAAIAALTRTFKADLVGRGIAPGKIAVVRNGVDLPRYGPRPADPELADAYGVRDCFTVGYLGTHGMAHALERVLEAAALLREEPRIRFLFVGPGAAREALIARAREQGLTNVVFVPPQPKERMPDHWALCDVALVHLKDAEVFSTVIPSKIFEAMGMGLPLLLAAPAGEASRIVETDGAGLHVPPEDPAALAAAVRRLRDDGALRQRLGRASLAAAPHHSREQQAREMLTVLEAAASGRGAEVAKEAEPCDACS
jgi:glycosyltransferase involved in cell wall biosynthesis